MWNFLNFNTFITQNILIIFYYMGAFIAPLAIFILRKYLSENIMLVRKTDDILKKIYNSFSTKQKIFYYLLLIFIFIFFELFWRMIFEFMIAYFDIHEYLYNISSKL